MIGDAPDLSPEDGARPELCDLCGTVVSDGSELYALVPDSSVIHAHDPQLDGKQFVSACTQEHLDELVAEHRRRPFVDEEQWAGKMGRVLEAHPEGMSEDDLARATGLTVMQLHTAALWQDAKNLEWLLQYGWKSRETGTA